MQKEGEIVGKKQEKQEVITNKDKIKHIKTIKKKIKIKKSEKPSSPKFTTDKAIAMDFATKVHKQFNNIIKATILFGSQTVGDIKPASDIDIIIIVDDAAINWDTELTSWYREELGKLISSQDYGRDLHINTIRLTTWWQDLMHGDPIVLNILRYGQALIDIAGFYNPIKSLLIQGRIHSTPEAVFNALQRAPQHLARSKMAQMSSIEGVYWTMVESAQAALITLGKLPPSPEHVTAMLKEEFTDRGILKPEYVKWYRDIYGLHKEISHGEIREIKGVLIDEWQEKAEKFMRKMTDIIDKLIEAKKSSS
ncbi:MAG: nucleotidyltransferase domain-containing protein [Candidatus Pacearchaeota archaeon]|nr:nucleotidyltransferase domain-containing protein [Candidatus Pacearchaeota archaeon]